MKAAAILIVTVFGVGMALPAPAQRARERGRNDDDRVCFYRDVQFQGQERCYQAGDELADLRGLRNEISSIRVFGRARVVVYDQREFSGASDEFDSDVPDLTLRNMEGSRTWNDRIESFQVDVARGRRRGRSGRGDNRPQSRVCVFDGPDFTGRSQCWSSGSEERNLSSMNGWNDRISSIRVQGRARIDVYRDANYRGERLRIDRDVPDLGAINWGDQISSFEVR